MARTDKTTGAKGRTQRNDPYVGSSDMPPADPDVHAAQRFAANPGVSAALERKLVADEVFIRNAQTKKAHAEKRRADADAHFIEGPRSEQTLADADLSRRRAIQANADAHLASRRADFIIGPETRKTYADADLASARTTFVREVETQKAHAEIFQLKIGSLAGMFVLGVLAFAVIGVIIAIVATTIAGM